MCIRDRINGADILGAGDDTDWYYFKDGKAKRAEKKDDGTGLKDGCLLYTSRCV